ncbi:sugar ABC transporter substrate-binding protein [Agromyces sp. NPDC058110]|uniref:sugar ABC transporter substrate-binding protein n=1 Tax=Agromyces sp. NPDC058110 TaxID=3346345 RepID=UPI0036DC6FA4
MNASSARRIKGLVAAGAVAVSALALVGCADSGSATSPSASTSAGSGDSDLDAALAAVEAPLDAYPVPTDAVDGIDAFKGETVYYVPVTLQSPQFSIVSAQLTEALETVGISVQVCDGKGNPSDIGSCIGQGTQAGAAAIVTDAVPYGLAANALDAAQAAGIPVVISNQIPDDTHPASETLGYVPAGGSDQEIAIAQWITKDSGGTANILINRTADGPSQKAYVQAGTDELDSICPDCTYTINDVSSSNFPQVTPSVSAALLNDPTIGYVVNDFAQFLQPTQGGVQAAGMMESVKGVTGSAGIGALQALESNTYLYAATGQANAYQGWVEADLALRLMTGSTVPEYTIPVRLFTRDNIGDVTLTEEAEASGEWFGPTTFREDFEALWGVA